jgi:hypothetical protein
MYPHLVGHVRQNFVVSRECPLLSLLCFGNFLRLRFGSGSLRRVRFCLLLGNLGTILRPEQLESKT